MSAILLAHGRLLRRDDIVHRERRLRGIKIAIMHVFPSAVQTLFRCRSNHDKLVNDWLIGHLAMASVTAFEAKTRFGQLLERVARGEEVVITKHDKPVARLIPEGQRSLGSVREAVHAIRALRRRISLRKRGKAKTSAAEIKSWIEEGRR